MSAAIEIPYTVAPRRDTGLYNGKLGIWLFLGSEVMLFGALFSSYAALRTGALAWPKGLLSLPLGTLNTAILITSSVLIVRGWTALKVGDFSRFKLCQGLTLLCALVFLGIKSIEYNQKFTHYEVWFTDKGLAEIKAKYPGHAAWLKPPGVIPGRFSVSGHIEGNPYFLTHKKLKAEGISEVTVVPDRLAGIHKGEHTPPIQIAASQIQRLSSYVPAHSSFFAIYFTLTALHALHVIGGILAIAYLWGPGSRMWLTQPERFTNRIECSVVYWHFVDFIWLIVFPLFYLF